MKLLTHPNRTGSAQRALPREQGNRIRVLFFNHTSAQGGAEIALLNLVRHLDTGKITPIVLFASDGPIVNKIRPAAETHVLPLSRSVVDARKDSLGLASLLRIRAVFSAISYVWILARFIRQHDIDVLHTNTLKAHLLGAFAARLSRRPVVFHLRDRIDNDYLPPLVVRLYRWLFRSFPNLVVANSSATLQSLHLRSQRASKPTTRSTVVHDGTDCPLQHNLARPSIDVTRVALIGRICPWKGQHIFLRAAALVGRQFPSIRFIIVGSALFGEDGYERQMHQLSNDLGINDLVTFTGFRNDVPAIISGMDLIVHASTIGEPFGQVIIEAMSAAKPVVATNGGGVPEIVEDGKTGLLVPMGDVPAMAQAISRIIAHPILASQMGARGRDRVRQCFTIQQTARKVESIYAQVLQLG
jgi:glycosyltransferase involved in cell wall biosynthesis